LPKNTSAKWSGSQPTIPTKKTIVHEIFYSKKIQKFFNPPYQISPKKWDFSRTLKRTPKGLKTGQTSSPM
jgi:hypothetical protein